MSNAKKCASLILAILFGLITCGVGFTFFTLLQKDFNKTEQLVAIGEVNYETDLANSGLSTEMIKSNTFYKIENEENLKGVAYAIAQGRTDWAEGNYVLENDLDLGNAIWTPIGTEGNPFVGKFNGNGHTIQGIISIEQSSTSSYVGLFGKVGGASGNGTAIYDLVIGINAFADSSSIDVSGHLAGRVENAVLADIYDWTYLSSPITKATIGSLGNNVTVYGGDSFTLATATTTNDEKSWTHDLKIAGENYDSLGKDYQFYLTNDVVISAKSIYIVDDEIGKYYLSNLKWYQ